MFALIAMPAARRVTRGAKLLDRVHPSWVEEIDPESLNIAHGSHCILGQLYGDYTGGLRGLRPVLRGCPANYGFEHSFDFLKGRLCSYSRLQQAWLREITHRKQMSVAA